MIGAGVVSPMWATWVPQNLSASQLPIPCTMYVPALLSQPVLVFVCETMLVMLVPELVVPSRSALRACDSLVPSSAQSIIWKVAGPHQLLWFCAVVYPPMMNLNWPSGSPQHAATKPRSDLVAACCFVLSTVVKGFPASIAASSL